MRTGGARRGAVGLGAALTLGTLLSGCQLPDVGMSPGLSDAAAETSAAPATTAATAPSLAPVAEEAPVTPVRTAGDLDTGSVTHTVATGDRDVVIDWWTDQEAVSWTAADVKTVQLAAHVEGGPARQAVKVTRFAATADDGTTRTTITEDRGEFVLTPPFDYTSALNVAPSAATATELTVYVQFDLLVETAIGSGEYFRQTVQDSIELPLLQETS
ncbi:hypothetical protein GCU67_02185 [Modestobacter muralis]|uniref:Uncharacterized protein n=1 Tax=Modestobacter muralis TaxID=1608614 RepID=A0A6P0H2A8_9ACTN|nr:hypothetical protein [Modestobacter muralis]NEK92985.1 hypothetical protein [Modestobacter muralis]NEN49752.1 hypothetical protein [Modestobacter muralis]